MSGVTRTLHSSHGTSPKLWAEEGKEGGYGKEVAYKEIVLVHCKFWLSATVLVSIAMVKIPGSGIINTNMVSIILYLISLEC